MKSPYADFYVLHIRRITHVDKAYEMWAYASQNHRYFSPNVAVAWLLLLLCIQLAWNPNFVPDLGCPDYGFHCFPQKPEKQWDNTIK
jgi:hypothetical protein